MTKITPISIVYTRFSAHRAESFAVLLSDDERRRAERFIDAAVKTRFIIARGILRTWLGATLSRPPESLKFGYGERGKPYLIGHDLRFNLSHAGDMLVLASTIGREVGVDVEQVRPMSELRTVARDNFSKTEFDTLFALPETAREAAFYRIWTRKEAYIKATGKGFALPLGAFVVSHDHPARFLDGITDWSLHALDLPDAYVGAVCVAGAPGTVTLGAWRHE